MACTSRQWVHYSFYTIITLPSDNPVEGDVEGTMDRPEGSGDEAHRAREKW
jgi:hypothetical protein